jgi:nitrate reductase assembly molybdenum cofactor insertion protein NarJ
MTDTVTTPSNSEPVDINGAAALYVELRDKIAEIKARMKEEVKPYQKGMEDLDAMLLKVLQDQGAKSIATPSGTVYQRVERSATIRDKKAFSDFVKENDQYDLIDWRANKVAVFDYIEENSGEVPGVNTSAFMTIGVRRGNSQEE